MSKYLRPGLHAAIDAAGYHIRRKLSADGVETWIYPDEVQPIIDSYTLAQAQSHLKKLIGIDAARQYDAGVLSSYGYTPSPHETNGWLKKEEEALAYQAWVDNGANGQPPKTDKIDPRVTPSNPLGAEVSSILSNAASLHELEDAISAWTQAKKDLVDALVDLDASEAIDIYSDAPV